jgi:hypothetical protein
VDPLSLQLQAPLKLQLGSPVTLHFVATDLLGCPVELSEQQRQALKENGGLQLLPSAESRLQLAVLGWRWGSRSGVSSSSEGAAAPANAAAAGEAAGEHLGGIFVNSVTFQLQRGCGLADVQLQLAGSSGETRLLQMQVQVEAGPCAVDGLNCTQLTAQLPVEGCSAPLRIRLQGIVDRAAGFSIMPEPSSDDPQPMEGVEGPAAAAAGGGVHIKPEPGLQEQQHQQQHQQQARRQHQQGTGSNGDPIDLIDSSEDEEEDGDEDDVQRREEQQQRQLTAREQWLASLNPATAVLMYRLHASAPVPEGTLLQLQLQLHDSSRHEIASAKPGKLRLRQLKHWQQQKEQQEQEPVELVPLTTADIVAGRAELVLQLGVGDEWCGPQLFEVAPAESPAGSDLAAVLPVLLRLDVVPGPFPRIVQLASQLLPLDSAAAAGVTLEAAAAEGRLPVVAAEQAAAAVCQAEALADLSCLLNTCSSGGSSASAAGAPPAGQVFVLPQQLGRSSSAPLPLLPACMHAFSVSTRSGDTLPPEALAPLQLQLQRWLPPPADPAAAAAAVHLGGKWVDVEAGCASVEATPAAATGEQDDGDDAGAAAAVAAAEFVVPDSCRQLPPIAGLYRLHATYADSATVLPSCEVGPFLLLPGEPSKLLMEAASEAAASPASTSRGGRPAGRGLGGSRPGSRPGNAAAAAAAAARASEEVVTLEELGTKSTQPQVLLLQDAWGNPWRPAAARLAAALGISSIAEEEEEPLRSQPGAPQEPAREVLNPGFLQGLGMLQQLLSNANQAVQQEDERAQPPPKRRRTGAAGTPAAAGSAAAAAAGDGGDDRADWQLQLVLVEAAASRAGQQQLDSLPFDANGSRGMPSRTLTQLGIAAVGEYQLVALAVPPQQEQQDSQWQQQDSLRAVLATWRVVAEGAEQLAGKAAHCKSQLRQLQQRVKAADEARNSGQKALQQARRVLEAYTHTVRVAAADLGAARNIAAAPSIAPLRELRQRAAELSARVALLCRSGSSGRPLAPQLLRRPVKPNTAPLRDDEVGGIGLAHASVLRLPCSVACACHMLQLPWRTQTWRPTPLPLPTRCRPAAPPPTCTPPLCAVAEAHARPPRQAA